MSAPLEESEREKPSHTPWRWSTVVTTFVSLSTVALLLMGYGYTLAVESVFGISAGLVAGSLTEYLQLSSYVIVRLVDRTAEVFRDWDTVERFYADFQWLVWIGLAAWFAFFVLWRLRKWWQCVGARLSDRVVRITDSYQQREPRWLKRFRGVLFWPLAWLGQFAVSLLRQVRALPAMFWWSVVSLAGILGLPIITLVIIFAVLTLLIVVYIWFPYIGLMVGMSALQEWVIKPEVCISIRNRDHHLLPMTPDTPSVAGAQCVYIKKDGKELARGRLVVSTLQVAILFDPVTGSVQRVPVDGATIHAMSSLD